MKAWKTLRINFMYWRFRNITSRRMRLQAWYRQRRVPTTSFRGRGTATMVYRRSRTRTWLVFLAMVVALTALGAIPLNGTIVYGLSALVVIAALYLALRNI